MKSTIAEDTTESADELSARIDFLLAQERSKSVEVELHRLRCKLGSLLMNEADSTHSVWPPKNIPDLFVDKTKPIPEIAAKDLSAQYILSGIAHHGCLVIRGLLSHAQADSIISEGRAILDSFRSDDFDTDGNLPERLWKDFFACKGMRQHMLPEGNLLAGDSASLTYSILDALKQSGLTGAITEALGERPALLWNKWGFRQTEPSHVKMLTESSKSIWHQDGCFMGEGMHVINAWISLCECGGENPAAPGINLIPRRLNTLCRQGSSNAARYDIIGEDVIDELSIITPVYSPQLAIGDAIIFDHYLLHRTQYYSPSMVNPRHAIESWFAGPSSYGKAPSPLYDEHVFPLIAS